MLGWTGVETRRKREKKQKKKTETKQKTKNRKRNLASCGRVVAGRCVVGMGLSLSLLFLVLLCVRFHTKARPPRDRMVVYD